MCALCVACAVIAVIVAASGALACCGSTARVDGLHYGSIDYRRPKLACHSASVVHSRAGCLQETNRHRGVPVPLDFKTKSAPLLLHCIHVCCMITHTPPGHATKLNAKSGMDALTECATDADNFEMVFPQGGTAPQKAIQITSMVLLDYYFFEDGGAH